MAKKKKAITILWIIIALLAIASIVSLIIPLFISAFQRAEDLANAMESRNYNPEAKRTRYKQLVWKLSDTISFLCVIAICIAMVIMSFVL